jgi:hypothetical protein
MSKRLKTQIKIPDYSGMLKTSERLEESYQTIEMRNFDSVASLNAKHRRENVKKIIYCE